MTLASLSRDVFMNRETNIIGMRLGPGKYLKGRTLLGGVITPEEFDHFHEVRAARVPYPFLVD